MKEENYVKLKIAYMIDENFNVLFVLLLWILEYKTAFWIFLGLAILNAFVRAYEIGKLRKEFE